MKKTKNEIIADNFLSEIQKYLEKHNLEKHNNYVLNMLYENYLTFLNSKDEVKKLGLLVKTTRGIQANPALKILNDAEIQIIKLLNEYALTLKSSKKLENENENNNLIDELTSDL